MQDKVESASRRTSPFDAIRHIDEQGNEYWSARDLYKMLGYSGWQKFQFAIEQAKKSCENSGLHENDIHRRKELCKQEHILDFMGSEELADNIFRAAQTDAKIRHEQMQGKSTANQTHYEVGRKVRQTIKDLGGTMPEDLPTPEKSIQQLRQEESFRLKHRDQPALFEGSS